MPPLSSLRRMRPSAVVADSRCGTVSPAIPCIFHFRSEERRIQLKKTAVANKTYHSGKPLKLPGQPRNLCVSGSIYGNTVQSYLIAVFVAESFKRFSHFKRHQLVCRGVIGHYQEKTEIPEPATASRSANPSIGTKLAADSNISTVKYKLTSLSRSNRIQKRMVGVCSII